MGPTDCHEMSVTRYQPPSPNTPEQPIPHEISHIYIFIYIIIFKDGTCSWMLLPTNCATPTATRTTSVVRCSICLPRPIQKPSRNRSQGIVNVVHVLLWVRNFEDLALCSEVECCHCLEGLYCTGTVVCLQWSWCNIQVNKGLWFSQGAAGAIDCQ